MTDPKPGGARVSITPAGLMFLAITSVGWGFNWPVTKYLLSELPPLTLRGVTGVIGACLLAGLALLRGQSLRVPYEMWPRLVMAAVLNVGCWMVLMGLALLWLPASEAALIAYTMPIWASMLAWPILGERPNLLRVISLVMAFAGLAAIMGGNGLTASMTKLPGIIMALGGALGFAVGTVLAKKLPLRLPPLSAAAWQIGIGCLPVAIVGLLIEKTDIADLSQLAGS
jgi:drug/metabolite transporter (DMT)-like permease